MPVKHTPIPKNKGKKDAAQYIDYEAELDRDDSGDEDLKRVGESDKTLISSNLAE